MKVLQAHLLQFIYLAGLAQIALVIGSLATPKILNWRTELVKVQPLIRKMFWTYAAYILAINLCFGLLSVFAASELTNGTELGMLVTAFIAAYWLSRVLIQFLYFDRASFPTGIWNKIGEAVLVTLFIFLTVIYGWAFCFNFQQP